MKMINDQAMGKCTGSTEADIKATGSIMYRTDMARLSCLMGKCMKGYLKIMYFMDPQLLMRSKKIIMTIVNIQSKLFVCEWNLIDEYSIKTNKESKIRIKSKMNIKSKLRPISTQKDLASHKKVENSLNLRNKSSHRPIRMK